jgi:methyl-accepting chemotaxis protein
LSESNSHAAREMAATAGELTALAEELDGISAQFRTT